MRRYAPISQLAETFLTRTKLNYVASRHVRDRDYNRFDLTPPAKAKLRKLDAEAVKLALMTLAYDVRATAAEIISLSERGQGDEASLERAALAGRVCGGWAWEKVSLPIPSPDLMELAAPLGLGLGTELRGWLLAQSLDVPALNSWIAEFGPRIDRFRPAGSE